MADDIRPPRARVNSLPIALEWLTANPDTYIFPIAPGAKYPPLVPNNLRMASNDRRQIERWSKRFPNCNWGLSLAKSNRLVVDVDCKSGKRGQLTFDVLDLWYGWTPTMKVLTPSGGFHLHYKGPHKFALGKRGFGEDIDSPNYVLLPGCVIASGAYKYYSNEFGVPNVSKAQQWMYDVLRKPAASCPSGRTSVAVVGLDLESNVQWGNDYIDNDAPPAIMGQNGDDTTVHVALVLRDHGISEATAFEIMAERYNVEPKCSPVWAVEELRTKVRNAFAYGTNAPGSATAQADFAEPYVGKLPTFKRPTKAQQRQQRGRHRQRKLAQQAAKPFKRAQ